MSFICTLSADQFEKQTPQQFISHISSFITKNTLTQPNLDVLTTFGPFYPNRHDHLSLLLNPLHPYHYILPPPKPSIQVYLLYSKTTSQYYIHFDLLTTTSSTHHLSLVALLLLSCSNSNAVFMISPSVRPSPFITNLISASVVASKFLPRISPPMMAFVTDREGMETTEQEEKIRGEILTALRSQFLFDFSNLKLADSFKKFHSLGTFLSFDNEIFDVSGQIFDFIKRNFSKIDWNTWSRRFKDYLIFFIQKADNYYGLFKNYKVSEFDLILSHIIHPINDFISYRESASIDVLRELIIKYLGAMNIGQAYSKALSIGSQKGLDDVLVSSIFKDLMVKRSQCSQVSLFGNTCQSSLHFWFPYVSVPRFPGDNSTNSKMDNKGTNGEICFDLEVKNRKVIKPNLIDNSGVFIFEPFLWHDDVMKVKKDQKTIDLRSFSSKINRNSRIFGSCIDSSIPQAVLINSIIANQSRHQGSKSLIGCHCGRFADFSDPPFSWDFLFYFDLIKKPRTKKKPLSCSYCTSSSRLWIQYQFVSQSLNIELTSSPFTISCLTILDQSNLIDGLDDSDGSRVNKGFITGHGCFPEPHLSFTFADVNLRGINGGLIGLAVEYECISPFLTHSTCTGCRFLLNSSVLASVGITPPSSSSDLVSFLLNNDLPFILPCSKCGSISAYLSRLHVYTPNSNINCQLKPIIKAGCFADDARYSLLSGLLLPSNSIICYRLPIVFHSEGRSVAPNNRCFLLRRWLSMTLN
ncbi:hypothetical protein P9112_003344 [Eukaryota sp. TZLM1-RC]